MTYQDILKQIDASGQTGQWSQWDLDTAQKNPAFGASMLSYKQDWKSAADDAGRAAANQAAEALRKQYGSYYGGTDGSKYYGLGTSPGSYQSIYQDQISAALEKLNGKTAYQDRLTETLDRMNGYGSFDYGPAPTYQNRYQQQLDDLLGKVQGYGPFSWNKEEDPAYSAYAKQYRREGDRASATALAQAAAATGGQPSSAAVTAAAQAGDYYAGQLADKIPELYQNAYQRYLSDYSLLADKLGQTQQVEQSDYAKYRDQLSQYNADRAQSYDQWLQEYNMLSSNAGLMQDLDSDEYNRRLNSLGALQGQEGTEYSRFMDQVSYNMQQAALDKEKEDAQKTLYQKQLDAILSAGGSPSAGLIARSGYENEYVKAIQDYYAKQAAASVGRSGGSSGTSRSGGSSSGGGVMDYSGLFAAAKESGNPQSFISNSYKKYGFTSSSGLYNDYKNWLESAENESAGTTDYWQWSAPSTWQKSEGQESGGGTGKVSRSNTTVNRYTDSPKTGVKNTVAVIGDGRKLVYVDGFRPMTFEELQTLVDSGQIIEELAPNGRYHYRKR